MTTEPVVTSDRPSSQLWIIPVLLVMLVFPALRVAGTDSKEIGVSLLYGGAAYLVAIYLFYGIARLTFSSRYIWLGLGTFGGAALAAAVGGPENLWFAEIGWLSVLGTSMLVGQQLKTVTSSFRVYVIGLIVLTALTLIAWYPTWQEVHALGDAAGDEMVKEFVIGLQGQGYTPEQVEQYKDTYKLLVKLSVWLTPASTVISAIVQFSLGFLWLTWRLGQTIPALGKVQRFTHWKVPFGLTPVTGVAILVRLVGNDAMHLVADNTLLVLAVFYAICGLSFMEYTLHRVRVSIVIRILFYLLLFLTQIAGLLVMVLIGFIDSFMDWRKTAGNVTVEQ